MEQILLRELKHILTACRERDVPVYVIGAYSLRAYDYLLRRSFDLDLAVEKPFLADLVAILRDLGFAIQPVDVWIAATKETDGTRVAVHIAVDYILDVASMARYPLKNESVVWRKPTGLDFALPVLALEGVIISKLLALRDNDVVDVVAVLVDQDAVVDAGRLYMHAANAGLEDEVSDRLEELAAMVVEGEVEAIWWERMGTLLTTEDLTRVADRVRVALEKFNEEPSFTQTKSTLKE